MNLPLKDSEVNAVGHAEELTLIHSALVALRRGDPAAKLQIQGSAPFAPDRGPVEGNSHCSASGRKGS